MKSPLDILSMPVCVSCGKSKVSLPCMECMPMSQEIAFKLLEEKGYTFKMCLDGLNYIVLFKGERIKTIPFNKVVAFYEGVL